MKLILYYPVNGSSVIDNKYIGLNELHSFSQDYDLVSDSADAVCVHFIDEWRDLQFKVYSELQIFEKLFKAILFTLRVFARGLLRASCRRNNFVYFV